MKKFMVAVIAFSLTGSNVGSVFAAEAPDCSCQTGSVASAAAVGKIVGSSGDVLYSAAAGYVKAKPNAKLMANSQIWVGEDSSADISVGTSCNLSIPANSEVSILQPKGSGSNICVKVASLAGSGSEKVQEASSSQGSRINLDPRVFIAVGTIGIMSLGGGLFSASN